MTRGDDRPSEHQGGTGVFLGGDGSDYLTHEKRMYGGAGNDVPISGTNSFFPGPCVGGCLLDGGPGPHRLEAGVGDDMILGLRVAGGSGDDKLQGDTRDDGLRGGNSTWPRSGAVAWTADPRAVSSGLE